MNFPSSTGKRFYCIFKDDFSGFKAAYTMKHKSETPDCFKAFAERMHTDTRKRPRTFRSDGRGEFKSNSFENWLSSQGILHQTSAAHTPQQNGVAEGIIEQPLKQSEQHYMQSRFLFTCGQQQ
jgi:transposase InsO family protein